MNLDKFAKYAEIISSVAVLITLLFLVIEVRENSAVIRASSYGQNIELLNDWRYQGASDPEISELFRGYMSGEIHEFSDEQFQRFSFHYLALWSIYENAYFAREYGILGAQEWDRFLSQACNQYRIVANQGQGYWENNAQGFLSREFYLYIPATCSSD